MRIDGEWRAEPDGIARPFIACEAQSRDGNWIAVPFLVDTGADRTVFNRGAFSELSGSTGHAGESLSGIGGMVETESVATTLRLTTTSGAYAIFRGVYAAVLNEESLDVNVLGRDILGFFATIVDYPKRVVCLVSQSHDYQIVAR